MNEIRYKVNDIIRDCSKTKKINIIKCFRSKNEKHLQGKNTQKSTKLEKTLAEHFIVVYYQTKNNYCFV
jgi:hypothetical protein